MKQTYNITFFCESQELFYISLVCLLPDNGDYQYIFNNLRILQPRPVFCGIVYLDVNQIFFSMGAQIMEKTNIFDVLTAFGIQQGGTIHQICQEAKKTAKIGYQQGVLCYSFLISACRFEGCVDGRLVTTMPDSVLGIGDIIVCIDKTQKEIIEEAIL